MAFRQSLPPQRNADDVQRATAWAREVNILFLFVVRTLPDGETLQPFWASRSRQLVFRCWGQQSCLSVGLDITQLSLWRNSAHLTQGKMSWKKCLGNI